MSDAMKAILNGGGLAFPTKIPLPEGGNFISAGMSLRDYFAAQALPAVIAVTSAGQHQPSVRDSDTHIIFAIARDAYFAADAMLKAREEVAA